MITDLLVRFYKIVLLQGSFFMCGIYVNVHVCLCVSVGVHECRGQKMTSGVSQI